MRLEGPRPTGFGIVGTLAVGLLLAASALGGAVDAVVRFGIDGPAVHVADAAPISALKSAEAGAGLMKPRLLERESEASRIAWDLPNLEHDRVDFWVGQFTTNKRDEFGRFLTRSGRYTPMISQKLEERGMPQDLIYLAMIESGFNPKAYSPAAASGLWQFIAETGSRYGLDINRAVDERNDPVKSTDAALDYLEELHDRFGSWYLAAAGYNTGENRVARIMRETTGSERGSDQSYYRIWDRLPRETRDYVPLMIAAARIAKEPAAYGFDDLEIESPMKFDEVTVPAATQLSAVAAAAGTTVDEIRTLNPHFKLTRTRNDMASAVRLPVGAASQFAARWDDVKNDPKYRAAPAAPATRRYKVRKGDNLTRIARRYGVSVRQIRSANALRSDFIRAGTVLKIPA